VLGRRDGDASSAVEGVMVKSTQGEDIAVPEWLSRTSSDGFIAVYLSDEQGPIVATEQYFNGLTPTRLHHLWSMSKSISVGLCRAGKTRDAHIAGRERLAVDRLVEGDIEMIEVGIADFGGCDVDDARTGSIE
jgi:hypothetical protein